MMSMIFEVIAKTDSIKPTNGAETGAGKSVIAIPTISAKNIMCSIFGLAPEIELKTLLGTMVLTTCIKAVLFARHRTADIAGKSFGVSRKILRHFRQQIRSGGDLVGFFCKFVGFGQICFRWFQRCLYVNGKFFRLL